MKALNKNFCYIHAYVINQRGKSPVHFPYHQTAVSQTREDLCELKWWVWLQFGKCLYLLKFELPSYVMVQDNSTTCLVSFIVLCLNAYDFSWVLFLLLLATTCTALHNWFGYCECELRTRNSLAVCEQPSFMVWKINFAMNFLAIELQIQNKYTMCWLVYECNEFEIQTQLTRC